MSAGDWFDGKTAIPPRISLKGRFDGGEADEVPAPVEKPAPAAAQKAAVVSEPPAAKPTLPTPAADNKEPAKRGVDVDDDDDDDDEDEPEPLLADRAKRGADSLPSPTKQLPPRAAEPPAQQRATAATAAPTPASKPAPSPVLASKPPNANSLADVKKQTAALGPQAAQAQDVVAQALDGVRLAQREAATAAERDSERVHRMLATLSEQVRGLASNVDTLVGAVRRVELEIESMREERG